jgi:hypothetical protein
MNDKRYLVKMIEKQIPLMKSATISIADIHEYWRMTLSFIPDSEKAWNFACFMFKDLLNEALRVHAEKGFAKTCIGLLTHLTKQRLRQPPGLLW